MGVLGEYYGKKYGSELGSKFGAWAGGHLGALAGRHLVRFKCGGRVRRTGPAILHKGEFVLPRGINPTRKQKQKMKKKK